MRRSLILVAVVAMALTLLAPEPVAARRPVALGVASQNSTDLAALDAFAASVGARPATWTLWSTWGDRGGRYRCFKGNGTCFFPGALARGLRDRGVTPLVYWQPTNPADPGAGRFERYDNTIAGKHDRYIREWARAAKAFGKPVIVRLAHEMNGTWFPWALTNFDNSPSRFVGAWRHVVRIFRNTGARNVRFLWSPFQRCGTCSSATYEQFYPGNGYVDYVGVSALNWGDVAWTSLAGLVDESLADLRRITRTARNPQGKPVILPEIASNHVGGDKAAWIRDGYAAVFENWKAVRAMSYFDYDTTFAGQPDWRLAQPPDGTAFQAYQSLATQRGFRASMPPRPAPGPRRWRLMPLIHVVAQDGTGDFATITEAVGAARAGDVILIRAGTYDESVSVGRDVTISGDGDRAGVVVQPSTGSPSFSLGTSGATLSNLTLRGPFADVTIDGGNPTSRGPLVRQRGHARGRGAQSVRSPRERWRQRADPRQHHLGRQHRHPDRRRRSRAQGQRHQWNQCGRHPGRRRCAPAISECRSWQPGQRRRHPRGVGQSLGQHGHRERERLGPWGRRHPDAERQCDLRQRHQRAGPGWG